MSSNAHRNGHLELGDLNWNARPYRAYGAYAASKLANLLFMSELQRPADRGRVSGPCGGSAPRIHLDRNHQPHREPGFDRVSALGNRWFGMPVSRGALPVLFAATQDVAGNSYLGPDRWGELSGWPTMVGRSARAADPELARALWERTAELADIDWGPLSRQ